MGLREPSAESLRGAGERPFFVAEQFAFDEFARDRRHVQRNERTVAALAEIVQCARHQFLAGAGFSGNHYGQVGGHDARDHPINVLHRRRSTDQGQLLLDRAGARSRRGVGQRAVHDRGQGVQIEWLRQVLKRAAFGRAHRGHQRALRTHDDDLQRRSRLADPRNEIQPVAVGHKHIGDHEIAVTVFDPAPQCSGVAGGMDLVSLASKGFAQDRANGAIVIGDQNCGLGHDCSWRSLRWSGSMMRKTVRRGRLSTSMTPP